MSKEFNPRKTIEVRIAKLRKGSLASALKDISDEDLFSLVLSGYEDGAGDTLKSLHPYLTGQASRAKNVDARLTAVESRVRAGKPAANSPIKPL